MQDFVPGQRWINDAQLQMGLGCVLKADFRTVTIRFPATGETFVYAQKSVPLTRVRFVVGDHIVTHAWFVLRGQTRRLQTQIACNPLRGLIGGRISLIPHQLYIAHTVANRFAPRVLLADEVGLGKTIEAGMIVHQQLVTGRARRVLIVVPENLVHQWLVEMLRRFNLQFTIFDADQFAARGGIDSDAGSAENPFHTAQLVLCALEFLSSRAQIFKQCAAGNWDLMVVDEAHHLQWCEHSPGFAYQLIDQLAQNTRGVLLLTATPEQLGKSGHYARLRLLDPVRFPGYADFIREEEKYRPIADAVEIIMSGSGMDDATENTLYETLGKELVDDKLGILQDLSAAPAEKEQARASLVEMLLDRHGTGRVLFRNTRAAVKGFPDRVVTAYPLDIPDAYQNMLQRFGQTRLSDAQLLLCPELLFQAVDETNGPDWTAIDPRVHRLCLLLKELSPRKVLVIAASATTALDLAEALRVKQGMDAAVFHENMNLTERDRAAAWFADRISGTRVLICSEIGSEGQNFQFAHHLVLFDLPLNPDLLEQRIGRLDRIGQTRTVNIHVTCLNHTAQQIMFEWYHKGLNAFAKTCPTGYPVFSQLESELVDNLHQPGKDYSRVIDKTADLHAWHLKALQQGRDRLLEFNSCRPAIASKLQSEARRQDRESCLQQYMETVFDCFDIDYEIHSEGCYAVNAGTHTMAPLPNLPDHGLTVTYDREIALANEDIDYLTWDHPLVAGAMDLIQAGELGNTAVVAAGIAGVKRGSIVLESIFILESASTETQHSSRFLPPTTLGVMIDQTGKRLDHHAGCRCIDSQGKNRRGAKLEPDMVKRILKARQSLLRKMVAASENIASQLSCAVRHAAQEKSTSMLTSEIERLEALRAVNPNVRQAEIDYYRSQLSIITKKLEESDLRLDALRVILAA